MQISVMFNDYEEMVAFANKLTTGATAADAVKAAKGSKAKVEVKDPIPSESESGMNSAPVGIEEEETKTYTLEEVRAAMAELTRKGKAKEVKAMLTSVGAKNLSGVDPKDYATLMEKAGAI